MRSAGQFYRQFLKPIRLNNETVPWREMDLSYLEPERWGYLGSVLELSVRKKGVGREVDLSFFGPER